MGKVLQPPKISEVEGKVIFLAGPIQGGPLWHKEAIRIIRSINEGVYIASPRGEYAEGEFVFNAQVDWETYYLNRAAKNGTIMFWLAREESHMCERPYAQTSRFELGEWKVKHERDGINLVVGIDEGFTNTRYIKRRLMQDCPNVSICSNLQETCEKAIELCLRDNSNIIL